ncbi:uncharacterized protein LOC105218115 isoform X2 [Zeugodacus cucurbitae]|uniref:uncharacterized protein LOC105218115 isoform X2 n=1 Tax=Zeugodacus cucurbitae TaxID=28588 RepID=UPI0023D90A35|nr:uncharacterized protein LOC105218115 isoform X2 [Zeugodacus cucurbitae]XP_054090337.1 uncharacterized protein LOC105218115 isoform X2 [Zeugodacus cucurbitae]
MDIESDDSERWEDFFGSSTELAPSLLGIYDTLTSALEASNKNTNNNTNNNNNNNNNNNSNENQHSSNSGENIRISEYNNNENACSIDVHSNGNVSAASNHSDSPTLSNQSSRSSSFSSEEKLSVEYTFHIDSYNNNNNNSNSSDSNRNKSNCHAVGEEQQQQQQKQQQPSPVLQKRLTNEQSPEALASWSSSTDSGFGSDRNTALALLNLAYSNSHSNNKNYSSSIVHNHSIKQTYSESSRSLNSLSSSFSNSQRSSSSGSGSGSGCHNSPTGSRLSRETLFLHSSGSNSSLNSPSKHRNQIRILSPNVQRIITHTDAEERVETVDLDALQQQPTHLTSPLQSPALHHRYVKKAPPPSATSTPNSIHKVKLSHIPLSKITGKLTQSGSELVETFDSSSEYLDALNFHSYPEAKPVRNLKKPPTPAVVPIPCAEASIGDGEVTPTNNRTSAIKSQEPLGAFNFSTNYKLSLPNYERQESIKLIEMEQLATTSQMITAACTPSPPTSLPLTVEQHQNRNHNNNNKSNNNNNVATALNTPPPIPSKEFIATAPLSPTDFVETLNYPLITNELATLTLSEKDTMNSSMTSVELIEAINKPVISKPLVRSSSAACASTVSGSPMLTYARSKSLAAKANTLGGAVPIKLPTAQQLEELEEASKMSAESLDRLTDIKSKFSPKESRKGGPMLPDIAKLKHRPLSSSSICSTSSSSSSGSDHLNGKLATSYLASVESLADQSENELMDPHSGMSVLERAMLEIVDSERSFVEDLGQVIKGYLSDWKERACLRYDELKILFSNIEEIYEFNSTLLKQLINSGMEPGKIAKCFIELRERFDVYTTYCTSYPEAISLLTKLLQATHTNALLTSTQKMLQHKLPLGSYLLKPVQRILKYHLLLDNLRKHCDVKEVLQAYEIMRQVARNIDQVKRKLEQQIRVKELSGILDGWLGPELTVLGELRQEGLLMEHNKPRMVFLFDTMLIITKSKEDNRLQFKSYIHQNNLMLSEHLSGEPTSFYVIPYHEPRNQIKLTAKNRDQKRLWAQHIKGVILEKFENIPNRAKELVYKLGDEEDRTPDKNTWKWSLHSTSTTPVYLERRNQYRRSEIRKCSKFKRKTVTNSTSFDSFNELAENATREIPTTTTATDLIAAKEGKAVARTNSIDDNMLPALHKLAAVIKNKGKTEEASTPKADNADGGSAKVVKHEQNAAAKEEYTSCIMREQRRSACASPKSPLFGLKALKERSKSVPRISFQCEDLDEENESLHGSNTNLDARKSKSSKSIEVKQYNHKTIPKRIATLKKQRTGKTKETCKFYMDLSEFDDAPKTELKITESTENLVEEKQVDGSGAQKDAKTVTQNLDSIQMQLEKQCEELLTTLKKKDADIILDLLKQNKEFERIAKKKQQRKRGPDGGSGSGSGSGSAPGSPESPDYPLLNELPPRPPSRSPPPLESEHEQAVNDEPQTTPDEEDDEPIYESLLRNVHVPYKFSPVLGRSVSTQQCKTRERKSPPAPRPESDYVTLVYSPEGALQQVGNEMLPERASSGEAQLRREPIETPQEQRDSGSSTSSSTCTLKRDSQNTVINVECASASNISMISNNTSNSNTEAIYARPIPKNLMKRLFSTSAHTAVGMGSKSSHENISSSHNSLLPRARKSIDNIALSFGRSNKPPERRVSDVTEMCRQSILHRQGSEAVGERMAHVDYADPRTLFTVNASNSDASLQRDSVFSLTSSNDSVCDQKRAASSALNSDASNSDFVYEDNVEACLENDFRDSAIYSDDNEKRADYESSDGIKRPRSPPPPPPPARNRSNPEVPPKPTGIPRVNISKMASPRKELPLPPLALADQDAQRFAAEKPAHVVICPPHLSAAASRSWVLQQIDNFNK